jgi:hypothetical protein
MGLITFRHRYLIGRSPAHIIFIAVSIFSKKSCRFENLIPGNGKAI